MSRVGLYLSTTPHSDLSYVQISPQLPGIKAFKLHSDGGIGQDSSSPAFGRSEDIRKREAADEGDSDERFQGHLTGNDVTHGHVENPEARQLEGRRYFSVTVAPFLAQDGHARSGGEGGGGGGR